MQRRNPFPLRFLQPQLVFMSLPRTITPASPNTRQSTISTVLLFNSPGVGSATYPNGTLPSSNLILITACWIYCWYVIIIHNLADSSRRYRDILLGGDCKITLISFFDDSCASCASCFRCVVHVTGHVVSKDSAGIRI